MVVPQLVVLVVASVPIAYAYVRSQGRNKKNSLKEVEEKEKVTTDNQEPIQINKEQESTPYYGKLRNILFEGYLPMQPNILFTLLFNNSSQVYSDWLSNNECKNIIASDWNLKNKQLQRKVTFEQALGLPFMQNIRVAQQCRVFETLKYVERTRLVYDCEFQVLSTHFKALAKFSYRCIIEQDSEVNSLISVSHSQPEFNINIIKGQYTQSIMNFQKKLYESLAIQIFEQIRGNRVDLNQVQATKKFAPLEDLKATKKSKQETTLVTDQKKVEEMNQYQRIVLVLSLIVFVFVLQKYGTTKMIK